MLMSCLEDCGKGRFEDDLVGEEEMKRGLCLLDDMAYEHSEYIV